MHDAATIGIGIEENMSFRNVKILLPLTMAWMGIISKATKRQPDEAIYSHAPLYQPDMPIFINHLLSSGYDSTLNYRSRIYVFSIWVRIFYLLFFYGVMFSVDFMWASVWVIELIWYGYLMPHGISFRFVSIVDLCSLPCSMQHCHRINCYTIFWKRIYSVNLQCAIWYGWMNS